MNGFFSVFSCTVQHAILVPQPGIEPVLPVVEVRSLNHWTAREVRMNGFLTHFNIGYCLHFMYTLDRGISHKRELSDPLTSLQSCLFHVSPLKGLRRLCN